MTQKLVLIGGLPGSGKSTMAREYVKQGFYHFEADQYFMNASGEYKFNPNEISDAHEWCQDSTRACLNHGDSVVVSNTFSRKWERQPYIDMATELNIPYELIEATGNYQNIHGCPQETIDKMKARWEKF